MMMSYLSHHPGLELETNVVTRAPLAITGQRWLPARWQA
jgi:hypothetical protein